MRALNLFAITTIAFTLLAEKRQRDWETGKVLDSQTAKQFIPKGTTTTDNPGGPFTHPSSTTNVFGVKVNETNLMIAGLDYTYTVNDRVERGATWQSNRKRGCRYVVGDEIKYFQEKRSLYVLDADGKECKLEIMKQERTQRRESKQ